MHRAISTIFLAPPAEQQLHALTKPLLNILVKRFKALRTSPHPLGVTKLEGLDHLYRIREGDYRIIYAIRNTELIILAVKSRGEKQDAQKVRPARPQPKKAPEA